MKLQSTITHRNGGLEQGLLQAVKETQELDEKSEARLKDLQSLPPNRTEVLNEYKVKVAGETEDTI